MNSKPSPEGRGFDDVFVYAPVAPLIEQADQLLDSTDASTFLPVPPILSFLPNSTSTTFTMPRRMSEPVVAIQTT